MANLGKITIKREDSGKYAPHVNTELCNMRGRLTIRVIAPVVSVKASPMTIDDNVTFAAKVQTIRCDYQEAMILTAAYKERVNHDSAYYYDWIMDPIEL